MQMFFRYLLKLPYHIRNLVHYSRALGRKEYTDMRVVKVTSDDYLFAAQKLHADVYLARGFVKQSDIKDGVLGSHIDPYKPHSQYFVVQDRHTGRIIATSRQIQAKKHAGHYSFAMFKHTRTYKKAKKLITSQSALDCVEISALAKQRGESKLAPLLLYRAMWQHSLRLDHKVWLLAVDTRLYHRLKLLFGAALQKAGPTTFYLGSDVVPAVLKVQSSLQALERSLNKGTFLQRQLRVRVARFILTGVPVEALNEKELIALKKIEAHYAPRITSTLRKNLRITVIAGLVGYTILRFLLVQEVFISYGVNPWIFLAIDCLTVVPYVLGIEYLTVALSKEVIIWSKMLLWGFVAITAFAAPYLYVLVSSSHVPAGLGVGLSLVVALLALNAVVNLVKRVRRNNQK